MSGNEKLERELESFLAEENSRAAALYRKLPRHEPNATLDASVLAMARNAVAPRRSRNRWLPALSAAAVVLVVAGVAYRAGPQVWNNRGVSTPPPTINAVDEAKTTAASPASAPAAAVPPAQELAPAMTAGSGVNTPKPVSVPARPTPTDTLARRKAADAPRLQSPAPSPEAFAQPQTAARQMEEKRADKSMSAAPPPPARDAPLQSLDAKIFPSDESQKAEAAANASDREQKDGAPSRAESVSGALKPTAAQPSAAPATAASEFARAPPSAVTKLAPNNRLYPEHWISNIQKMLRENRRDEAIRSLDEFRKQYPDYALPDDLRDLK
jgi:hypothetical protein